MRLAEFQQRLQDAILAPVLASSDADLAIRTGPCRNACAHYRIAIHHSHFWTRMRDFALYRYPFLARALGDAAFDDLVRAYIAAHPPTAYTLGAIVDGLQAFLESPVLADLAAFDFVRSGLRITAEEATLSPEDLAAIPASARFPKAVGDIYYSQDFPVLAEIGRWEAAGTRRRDWRLMGRAAADQVIRPIRRMRGSRHGRSP